MKNFCGFIVLSILSSLSYIPSANAELVCPGANELRQETPYETYLREKGLQPKETLDTEEIAYKITVFKDGSSEVCSDGKCNFFYADGRELSPPAVENLPQKKFGFASQIASELTRKN